MALPAISIVIPTLNEEGPIGRLLADVTRLRVPVETIVADGGSTDRTVAIAMAAGARVVHERPGRGAQLAAGARIAAAPILCFLHADARLSDAARAELERVVREQPRGAFAFRFAIDAPGWRYRVIEAGVRLRMLVARLPYGDQGLILSRADYDAAGGYRDLPILEDVALIDALRRVTIVQSLHASLPVSARRWIADGVFRRTLRNWRILIAYRRGASPHDLARLYRPNRDASPVVHA